MFCEDAEYPNNILEDLSPFTFDCSSLLEELNIDFPTLLSEDSDTKESRIFSAAKEVVQLKAQLKSIEKTKRYTDMLVLVGKIISVVFGVLTVLVAAPTILMIAGISKIFAAIAAAFVFALNFILPMIGVSIAKTVVYKYIGYRLERLYDAASEIEDEIRDGAARTTVRNIKEDANRLILRIR